jgi:hypothetical protein
MSQLTDLVLHVPWWAAGMLALVGAAMIVTANRRLDKTLQRLGVALVLLAVVLTILHAVFPSDREKLEKRTRQIVAAIDHKDWTALRSLLDTNTALGTASRSLANGRDTIASLTKTASETYGLKSLWVSGVQSQQTDALITVSVDVVSNQDETMDRPVASAAQFDYQQNGDDWVLEKITIIRIQDQTDPNLNLLK